MRWQLDLFHLCPQRWKTAQQSQVPRRSRCAVHSDAGISIFIQLQWDKSVLQQCLHFVAARWDDLSNKYASIFIFYCVFLIWGYRTPSWFISFHSLVVWGSFYTFLFIYFFHRNHWRWWNVQQYSNRYWVLFYIDGILRRISFHNFAKSGYQVNVRKLKVFKSLFWSRLRSSHLLLCFYSPTALAKLLFF